ncbi:ABC transporter substrate binding protein [Paenibacillus sp. YN15]|uniref:ABC transporter substrate binding protein n=1 Tax=Paenibacillus sp. YN15 TaxID=1742774 RepID=UPI000DCDC1CE|nr:ABC transporter substrate binding protein [Paenibacillus sp. YN15]RAU93998.1 hypothetical protein DQG13_24500 [Paenibacillus sp. YN15]
MPGFRQRYLQRLMLLFLIVTAAAGLAPGTARSEEKMIASPRVLVLNSYHKGFEWTDEETAGITDALKKAELHPVIYTEYADWKRFPSEYNRENLFSNLLYKYSGTDIDLIVAFDDFAVEFALQYRKSLFNNAPMVYAGVVEEAADTLLHGQRNVTGVLENVDPIPTIRTAKAVNPGLSSVYLLHDRSESGIMTGKQIQEKIRMTYPELTVVPLDDKTFPQVLDVASGLNPERDMIFMTTYYSDASGSTVEFEKASKDLSLTSKAPVYHLYNFGMNYGGFGGSTISGKKQGEEAAALALRILKGERADEIPRVKPEVFTTTFSYEMLRKFGIGEERLPEGSIILNKPFSFYDEYRPLVLGVFWSFVALVGFILLLLLHIRQTRRMRRRLAGSNMELTMLNRNLEASEEVLRRQFKELSFVKESLFVSEERFRLATDGSEAVIWDLDMEKGRSYYSDRWYELMGYPRDPYIISDDGWRQLIHPEDVEEADRAMQAHLRGETPFYAAEYRMRKQSGEYIWFQVRGKVSRGNKGEPKRFAGSMTDITERKNYEAMLQKSYQELEATYEEVTALQDELMEQYDKLVKNQAMLARSEERYRLITEATNDGVWEVDYTTGETFISPRWWDLMKVDPSRRVKDFAFSEMIHPDDLAGYEHCIEEHKSGKSDYYQYEYRLRLGTGEYRWFLGKGKAIRDENGQIIRVVGADLDIHDLKTSEEKLHDLAYFDPLTGLPNRLSLTEELERYVGDADAHAVIFYMDIDNFKYINDTMGYSVGDELIRLVSRRLDAFTDVEGTFYRLGGDEFVMLHGGYQSPEVVARTADRLIRWLKEPFLVGGSIIHLAPSIGIVRYPEDGRSAEELLMFADVAMYKAKETCKGGYILYGATLQQSFAKRMEIERHLRNALQNGELELHYQPQYELQNDEISGFEALIRWNSPQLGNVSPLSFIPIAEACQLILPIGAWVLVKACRFIRELQRRDGKPYRISVNISVVQLVQDDFISTVLDSLKEADLAPEYLEIEITESIFMESFDRIVEKLDYLKALGIRIALDDFGTGYSSLSYLKALPITTLKVDKTFIDDVPGAAENRSLASSIVMIGHRMGLEVVAEGVESREQLQYLRSRKCDKIQGYYISKPLPEHAIVEWLRETAAAQDISDTPPDSGG